MVIGARYHSIVFAINNCVPFVCLSYEHKMSGMLESLHLNDMCYGLKEEGTDDRSCVLDLIDNVLNNRGDHAERVRAACDAAKGLAKECFDKFTNMLSDCRSKSAKK